MKNLLKGLLYLFVFSISVRPALAADPVNGGVEVGANIGSFSVSGSDAAGNTVGVKAGFVAGGFVEFPINGVFSVQPEVVYAQKPFTVSFPREATQTEHVAVVEIPILAKINFNPQSRTRVYAVAGPSIAILARAIETTEGSSGENDLKPQLESADATIIAGLGVSVGHFGIEGRYDGGLRNLNKSLNGTAAGAKDRLSVKERSFTILARWAFR